MKVRDVVKLVEEDRWYHVETKGDHRRYKHPVKKGRTTISGHPGKEMSPGTFNAVLKQAQIDKKSLRRS